MDTRKRCTLTTCWITVIFTISLCKSRVTGTAPILENASPGTNGNENASPRSHSPGAPVIEFASKWTAWSAWSICMEGNQMRVRGCYTFRGFQCSGLNTDRRRCDERTGEPMGLSLVESMGPLLPVQSAPPAAIRRPSNIGSAPSQQADYEPSSGDSQNQNQEETQVQRYIHSQQQQVRQVQLPQSLQAAPQHRQRQPSLPVRMVELGNVESSAVVNAKPWLAGNTQPQDVGETPILVLPYEYQEQPKIPATYVAARPWNSGPPTTANNGNLRPSSGVQFGPLPPTSASGLPEIRADQPWDLLTQRPLPSVLAPPVVDVSSANADTTDQLARHRSSQEPELSPTQRSGSRVGIPVRQDLGRRNLSPGAPAFYPQSPGS